MEIMAAHRVPYAATASIGFPDDLMGKVKRAMAIRGTRFIHVLSPCPTGWKMAEHLSPKVAVASVETNIFPLYEVVDGLDFTITHASKNLPVAAYLGIQGRYKHLTDQEEKEIQKEADRAWFGPANQSRQEAGCYASLGLMRFMTIFGATHRSAKTSGKHYNPMSIPVLAGYSSAIAIRR